MLKKPSNPSEILDDDYRRAYAAQEIKKTILIWGAVKLASTAAVVITLKVIAKKLEANAASED
jgi:hypothetical protein